MGDQISRPMQVVLAVALAFAVLWFVALRPKAEEAPAAATPSSQPAASAATSAQPSGGTSKPIPAKASAATGVGEADPTAARRVAKAVEDGKIVVILFWNSRSAEDRAAREALRGISRRNGKVAVFAAPIGRVADYEAITKGVQVTQAPTTVIVDTEREARTVVGLTTATELNQVVLDSLAATR